MILLQGGIPEQMIEEAPTLVAFLLMVYAFTRYVSSRDKMTEKFMDKHTEAMNGAMTELKQEIHELRKDIKEGFAGLSNLIRTPGK